MVNILMLKFVTVFAFFALFVSAFASWSGAGESVAGWNDFTTMLNAGPGGWFIATPQPPGTSGFTDFSDTYSVTYPHLKSWDNGTCASGAPNDPDPFVVFPNPRITDNLAPTHRENFVLYPLNDDVNNTGFFMSWAYWTTATPYGWWDTQSVQFEKGDWTISTYVLSNRTNVKYTFGWTVQAISSQGDPPSAGGQHCGPTGGFFSQVFNPNYPSSLSNKSFSNTKITPFVIHVKVDSPITLVDNGGIEIIIELLWATVGTTVVNDPITFLTEPGNFTKLDAPPSHGSLSVCPNGDVFCAIGHFFGSVVSWIGFVIVGFIWLVITFFTLLVWLLVIISVFFIALFALSFSGAFGPAGAFIGIFTTIFLVYLIITIIYWARGTSGSIGV